MVRMQPSMTRVEHRTLLFGIAVLAAAMVLLELYGFRLSSAGIGEGVAIVVGFLAPCAAALGAALGVRRARRGGPEAIARAAAHAATIAGAFTAGALIALTWVSQSVAHDKGEGEPLHVVVAIGAWVLPALFCGAALGLAWQCGAVVLGRVAFAEALGGVLACMLVPPSLQLGAPRAALATAALLSMAAFCFAYVGRSVRPRWAMMTTLPLAVAALLAGDFGAPWITVKSDLGPRGRVTRQLWTDQGMIAVDQPARGKTQVRIDRGAIVTMEKIDDDGNGPTRTAWRDLLDVDTERVKGPALVINSIGLREVGLALASGHDPVDMVQLDETVLNDLMLAAEYAVVTHDAVADARVRAHVGDGRALLRTLGRQYQRVAVMGDGRYTQSAPRLLMDKHRLFTIDAIRDYLGLLEPDRGRLLLSTPRERLPSVLVALVAALGGDRDRAFGRLVVCTKENISVLLLDPKPLGPPRQKELMKHCKSKAAALEYPYESAAGKRDADRWERERNARIEQLLDGEAATDDRPFVHAPAHAADIVAFAIESLRALEPVPSDASGFPVKPKQDTGEAKGEVTGEQIGPPTLHVSALSALLAAGAAAVLLLVFLAAPRRRWQAQGVSVSLTLSIPCLGVAMALALFSATDTVLGVLGDAAYGWSLLIPVAFVGTGGGRLLADTVAGRALRSKLLALMVVGLLWLTVLYAALPLVAPAATGRVGVALVLALLGVGLTAALVGAPLAWMLRHAAGFDSRAMTSGLACWGWGAHQAGWALGGVLAALLVQYVGVSRLLLAAAVAYAFALALFVAGTHRAAALPRAA